MTGPGRPPRGSAERFLIPVGRGKRVTDWDKRIALLKALREDLMRGESTAGRHLRLAAVLKMEPGTVSQYLVRLRREGVVVETLTINWDQVPGGKPA